MNFSRTFKRKRRLWHSHYIPSLLAGIVVAIITMIFEVTLSSVVLFASVGASAVILTNSKSHHLTKLRTTISAYVIAIVVSSAIYGLNLLISLYLPINMFLIIFFVGTLLFVFDSFHPPAITAALSFILIESSFFDLISLFVAVISLFIVIRFITYVVSQGLSVKRFAKEFVRGF